MKLRKDTASDIDGNPRISYQGFEKLPPFKSK